MATYDKTFRKVKYEIWTGEGERAGGEDEWSGTPKGFQVSVRCKAKGCKVSQRHGHNKGTSFETEAKAIEWAVKLIERHIDRRH